MLLAIASFAESPFSALPVSVSITGITAQTNVGNATTSADANTTLTGQLLNTFTNNVTITANANVIPTGVQANSEVGIIGTNAWQLINTGASNNWTEVALVA